jgi:hypothetical protein
MGANARVVAAVPACWLVTPANDRPEHAGGEACATLVVSNVSSSTINGHSVHGSASTEKAIVWKFTIMYISENIKQ